MASIDGNGSRSEPVAVADESEATLIAQFRERRSRRDKYDGWPEELRKAHSLLRRMIRPVVGYLTPTDAEVEAAPNQLVLDLCRKHPALATEKFLCHNEQVELSPLKFLIFNKANIEVITRFCESFPHSAQQLDGRNDFFNLDGYPLHLACTIRQNDGDLIALLARAYPPAVSTLNQGGCLPLHLLLEYRGFTPDLRGFQALVEIDPKASIRAAPLRPPPVFGVLSSGQLSLEHMMCIYNRLPRHVIRLDFPTTCFHGDRLSLDHAKTISRILPQIQELNLPPPLWSGEAWTFFVQAFEQHGGSLRKLALKPPAVRVEALFQLLRGCTALEMLDLQRITIGTVLPPVPDLTVPIAHLLTHGRLVSLRVIGYELLDKPIFETLVSNTHLKHLVLHGLQRAARPSDNVVLPGFLANDTEEFSFVLEHHNITLQRAQIHYSSQHGPTSVTEAARIRHYTRLNRLGRAAARDNQRTTVDQVAHMLTAAQMDPELRACPSHECLGVLYGLLRESPGVWSDNRGDGSNRSTETSRKRKQSSGVDRGRSKTLVEIQGLVDR